MFRGPERQRYRILDLKFMRGIEPPVTVQDPAEYLGRHTRAGMEALGKFRLAQKNACTMGFTAQI